MPPALTPALARDYVRELSADVRAGVVLAGDGSLLAGPAELADGARALLAAAGGAVELEVVTPAGVVCAARSPRHGIVAVCGRFALPGVTRQDLRAALAALDGEGPPDGPGVRPAAADAASEARLEQVAETLISALQRGSET